MLLFLEKEEILGIWSEWDQENLLKITEEFASFMENMHKDDKTTYFMKFIR